MSRKRAMQIRYFCLLSAAHVSTHIHNRSNNTNMALHSLSYSSYQEVTLPPSLGTWPETSYPHLTAQKLNDSMMYADRMNNAYWLAMYGDADVREDSDRQLLWRRHDIINVELIHGTYLHTYIGPKFKKGVAMHEIQEMIRPTVSFTAAHKSFSSTVTVFHFHRQPASWWCCQPWRSASLSFSASFIPQEMHQQDADQWE